MLEKLKEIVNELYELYGETKQVTELTEILDYLISIDEFNGVDTDWLH